MYVLFTQYVFALKQSKFRLITVLDNLISLLDFTFRLEDIYIYQICVSRAKMISLNFVLECVAEFAATRFISASIGY